MIIDHQGQVLGDYLAYTDDLSSEQWRSRYVVTGAEEVERALLQKNTIPNASAVVFRRSAIPLDVGGELVQFKFAGDWLFYAMVLRVGKIAFIPEALNRHRRHDHTVRRSFEKEEKWYVQETLKVRARIADTFAVTADAIARSIGVSAWEDHVHSQQSVRQSCGLSAHPGLTDDLVRLRTAYECRAGLVREEALRILIIAHDLEVGGGQLAPIRLANRLAKKHRVLLCNARPWRINPQILKQIDPSVRLLEGTLLSTPWSYQDGSNKEEWPKDCLKNRIEVLRELVQFHRVDLIHSHVWWADKLAYQVSRQTGLPWFIHMHGDYEALTAHPEWDPEFLQLVRPMMSTADGLFYLTGRNLRVFEAGLADKPRHSIQVFNGFDPAAIDETGDRSVARSESDVVFVLVARAVAEKGWEEAIRATQGINSLAAHERGGRTAKLLLIGGGPYADELRERFAHDRSIVFCGQVVPVTEIVVQCDIGLLPSRLISESVPLAVIEYLACGLPVIATGVGAVPEMIRHKKFEAGTIMPLRPDGGIDVELLTRTMLGYMTDSVLRQRHQADARAIFDAQFHIDRMAAVCEEMFLDRLKAKKSPNATRLPAEIGLDEPGAVRRLAS
jgi:glycosyltransferase involved in cell wall biosynthesis